MHEYRLVVNIRSQYFGDHFPKTWLQYFEHGNKKSKKMNWYKQIINTKCSKILRQYQTKLVYVEMSFKRKLIKIFFNYKCAQ
jgi:hypothetical protein